MTTWAAANESTAGQAHDTNFESSQQNSAEVQQGPAAHEHSVHALHSRDMSANPSNSEQDSESASAILAEVQNEPHTGNKTALEDGEADA